MIPNLVVYEEQNHFHSPLLMIFPFVNSIIFSLSSLPHNSLPKPIRWFRNEAVENISILISISTFNSTNYVRIIQHVCSLHIHHNSRKHMPARLFKWNNQKSFINFLIHVSTESTTKCWKIHFHVNMYSLVGWTEITTT